MQTCDASEMEAILAHAFGASKFDSRQTRVFNATASSWQSQSGQLGIAGCDYSAHAKATFPSARLVRCHLGSQGYASLRSGGHDLQMAPGGVETIPADRDLIAEFQPGFSQIVLRFDQDYLRKTLSRLIDSPVVDLHFAPGCSASKQAVAAFRRSVFSVAHQILSPPPLPAAAIAALTESVGISFLYLSDHNFSNRLRHDPAPSVSWQLARAEDFIFANWAEPITITDLVAAAQCSARALFKAFAKERGTTPMEFLKNYRLEQARNLLAHPNERTTVLSVSQRCCFSNQGHFARDYRLKFGELPSATLKMAHCARKIL